MSSPLAIGQELTWRLQRCCLYHYLCGFTHVFQEKLRRRSQRAIFQSDDADRYARIGQCNRQDLDLWIAHGKPQGVSRKDREKAPAGEKTHPNMRRIRNDDSPRIIELL